LWSALTGAYRQLGFDRIDDEAFALVGTPILEPNSKLNTIRVSTEFGLPTPPPTPSTTV